MTDLVTVPIQISFQGKIILLDDIPVAVTRNKLVETVFQSILAEHPNLDRSTFKLLYQGQNIVHADHDRGGEELVFRRQPSMKPPPRLLAMASRHEDVSDVQMKRSDPTIRGFANDPLTKTSNFQDELNPFWGTMGQDRNYKFVRIEPCSSFRGFRPEQIPHTFEARRLLEKLASDPGIVAIMKERKLVVNTLGEMDPVDDRLMQKKEIEGSCLLGYNTNHGLRIDLRLRSGDLQSFLPYNQIAATLIHEISHNWFGEHDLYFWTNYGQMRVEYLCEHFYASPILWKGKTSAQWAELPVKPTDLSAYVVDEMEREMTQHGLSPHVIASAIKQRCDELLKERDHGITLGGTMTTREKKNPRDLALEAAERRARQQKERDDQSPHTL